MSEEQRSQYIATEHGFWQILPPQPLPDPKEISDEERYEAARRYITARYAGADPWITGAIMNEQEYQGIIDWYATQVEAGRICGQCGGPASAPLGDCTDSYHNQEGQGDVSS